MQICKSNAASFGCCHCCNFVCSQKRCASAWMQQTCQKNLHARFTGKVSEWPQVESTRRKTQLIWLRTWEIRAFGDKFLQHIQVSVYQRLCFVTFECAMIECKVKLVPVPSWVSTLQKQPCSQSLYAFCVGLLNKRANFCTFLRETELVKRNTWKWALDTSQI